MTREHDTRLRFSYADQRRARVVANAIAPEVGEIDDARSTATVDRDGDVVSVRIVATDLVALRAGINSWSRLVETAERVASTPERVASTPERIASTSKRVSDVPTTDREKR